MKRKSILLTILLLTSCTKYEALTTHVVGGYFINGEYISPMNTVETLKMYNKEQYNEVVNNFDSSIVKLSKEVDRYRDYENIINLKTINDSCGSNNKIYLSDDLYDLIALGIDLTIISKGAFNIAMGNLIDLYDFDEEISGTFRELPQSEIINEAIKSIPDYKHIKDVIVLNELDHSIILNKYNDLNVKISLGAIAKGYIMDKACSEIKEKEYPAIADAGSSTIAFISNKPNASYWSLSFREPLINDTSKVLVKIQKKEGFNLSSSGDSIQNFFYTDENSNTKLLHHILDANTGISNSYYRSVSLISENASLAILDAMSTAIFNMEDFNDVQSFIKEIEKNYSVDISYFLVKPYYINENIDYSKFDVVISESFAKLIDNTSYSSDIISKEIIYGD